MVNTLRNAILALVVMFSAGANATPEWMDVQYEGLYDGDTIYVQSAQGRTSYKVRLAAIDAPEIKQNYGIQSKAALTQLLRGAGHLRLRVDSTDRYGRLVAIVVVPPNRNINLEMVAQGAAWVYDYYASKAAYSDLYPSLKSAEEQARIRRLGVWADADATPPWQYRRQQ